MSIKINPNPYNLPSQEALVKGPPSPTSPVNDLLFQEAQVNGMRATDTSSEPQLTDKDLKIIQHMTHELKKEAKGERAEYTEKDLKEFYAVIGKIARKGGRLSFFLISNFFASIGDGTPVDINGDGNFNAQDVIDIAKDPSKAMSKFREAGYNGPKSTPERALDHLINLARFAFPTKPESFEKLINTAVNLLSQLTGGKITPAKEKAIRKVFEKLKEGKLPDKNDDGHISWRDLRKAWNEAGEN